ncbi:phage N-6-adenine-methyltransferase [Shewanella sp.]|uniref:phage N-6-adenine-methyltransferase n=1 Tax=Shewanella sp. TaxID=50422 RepID=UPI003F397A82
MTIGFLGSTTPFELRDLWQTPDYIFTPLHHEFSFSVDVAASDKNHLLPLYFTEQDDALSVDWLSKIPKGGSRAAWCNPPYSNIGPWMKKAANEAKVNGIITVMFVPNTPDAGWWPMNASEIRFIVGHEQDGGRNVSGRIHFLRADTGEVQTGNNKGSCFVIFAPGSLGNMHTKYVTKTQLIEHYRCLSAA